MSFLERIRAAIQAPLPLRADVERGHNVVEISDVIALAMTQLFMRGCHLGYSLKQNWLLGTAAFMPMKAGTNRANS